ncbi:unnamed protein product, partial [Rotaria magnacalcarata]
MVAYRNALLIEGKVSCDDKLTFKSSK